LGAPLSGASQQLVAIRQQFPGFAIGSQRSARSLELLIPSLDQLVKIRLKSSTIKRCVEE
jgi:hypothetical protein